MNWLLGTVIWQLTRHAWTVVAVLATAGVLAFAWPIRQHDTGGTP